MSDQTPVEPARALVEFTPVPRLKNRSDGWKPEIQRAFIEALADTGSVASACRMVGRSEGSAYSCAATRMAPGSPPRGPPRKATACCACRTQVLDRALNGVEAPLLYHGEIVATYRKHDNRLAAFILRNHLPEQYGEDGGRRPHAIDARKLARLKNEWQQEWQAERDREEAEEDAANLGFIEQITDMHVKWWSQLTPRTRAAYVHFRRLERIEGRRWLDEEEDIDAALAEAEAEYAEVFAGDGRSRAKLLGEVCGVGDEVTGRRRWTPR